MAPKAADKPKGPKYADIVKAAISSLKVGLFLQISSNTWCRLADSASLSQSFGAGECAECRKGCMALYGSHICTFAGEGRFQPACHQEVCGRAPPQPARAMGEDPQLPDQEDGSLWQACEGNTAQFL